MPEMPPEAPQGAEGAPQPGGAQSLIAETHTNLAQIADMLAQSGMEGPAGQMKQLLDGYRAVIEEVVGGGAPQQGPVPAEQGNVPPETAGKPAVRAL